MSVIGQALGLMRPQAETFNADPNDARIWTGYASQGAQSGERIDPETALKLSTAWAGVSLIANSIGMLPMAVFERMSRGRREAREHPLYDLLHTQPNPSMSASAFKGLMTAHALLRGDALAEIIPGPRGVVDQLRPIHPDDVRMIERLPNWELRYRVRPANGIGPDRVLNDDQVFHLRGLSLDGITGVSFVRYGVESLGLARAAEGYAGRVFRNDATPRGVLQHPGKLTTQAAERLKDQWEFQHSGPNQHRLAVLEEGMEFKPISISPEDTQMLASREYQDVDIARWLGVPLFLLQIMTKSTSWGSGLEQIWDVFIATGLGFWATQWEQAIAKDLIVAPQKYYVKINLTALIKGDIEKRYNAYSTGIMGGFLLRNEAREKEDLNPIDGLDEPLAPLNMTQGTPPSSPPRRQGGGDETTQGTHPSPSPLRQGGGDGATQGDGDGRHYQALLRESAARVVRKEIVALTKAARRAGDDFAAWEREVREFYADHAEFCAQTLQMPRAVAQEYVASQIASALELGVPALTVDEAQTARMLAEWAADAGKAVG